MIVKPTTPSNTNIYKYLAVIIVYKANGYNIKKNLSPYFSYSLSSSVLFKYIDNLFTSILSLLNFTM